MGVKWLFLFTLWGWACASMAQVKNEREIRISKEDVPENALQWFNEVFPEAKRVKWYLEETSGKLSFEAKLKSNGRKLSVEFSQFGQIEDIESEIEWKRLPDLTKQNLEDYFRKHYSRYSVRKVQRQFSGNEQAMKFVFSQNGATEITTRYEIEFYGVDDDRKALWEGLFTEEGDFIHRREIVLRPTDNLNY